MSAPDSICDRCSKPTDEPEECSCGMVCCPTCWEAHVTQCDDAEDDGLWTSGEDRDDD